jgi:hypothetical protein
LVVTGSLTLAGTLNLTESSPGGFLTAGWGSRWRLIEYSGELTDEGLSLGTMPSLSAGLNFVIDTNLAGHVDLVVIPEPASALLWGAGAVSALTSWRRRESNGRL